MHKKTAAKSLTCQRYVIDHFHDLDDICVVQTAEKIDLMVEVKSGQVNAQACDF